jgi:uncharacterized iron-regulated protein
MSRLVVWLNAVLLLVACALTGPPAPEGPPPPPRIYAVAEGREADERELLARLSAASFIVLGEAHDNAEHHELQARVIERIVLAGVEPAVAFEMLRVDQQDAVDAVLAAPDPTADAVRDATEWDESGWPPFELYAPVFDAALAAGLPIAAADLSREDLAALRGSAGADALVAELGLGEPLPAETRLALERQIIESHCGHATDEMLPGMVLVQRARDARLARSIFEAAGGEGRPVVLVAGAGHARLDRGAPRALAQLAPGADVVALAFLELPGETPGEADEWDELVARYEGAPPFDYVWLTEPQPREDPCKEFEEALRNMGVDEAMGDG